MRICAVVIWYNPDCECLSNIKLYCNKVEKVYVVDNSKSSNAYLLNELHNISYIPNFDNLGIATALNIGCCKAIEDGFEWCMTMDQDSKWESSQLDDFFSRILNNISDKNVSFAPNLKLADSSTSILGDLKRKITGKKLINNYDVSEHPNKYITSGNVINLKIWNEVGRFEDDLFIDEVDHEFCFKLKKHGYELTMFKDIYMNQTIGGAKKSLFPKESHSAVRIFYMIRNRFYMLEKYPEYCEEENYKKSISDLIRGVLLTCNPKKIKYAIKGYYFYKQGKLGRIN